MIKVRTFLAAGAAVGLSALFVVACSGAGDSGGSNFGGNGNGNGGSGAAGGSGGTGAGGGFAGSDGGSFLDVSTNNDSALNSDSACASYKAAGQQQPVDLFIMLDQSGSMDDGTKWPAVVNGLTQFVNDPATAGMWVGMQYFALPEGGGASCPSLCDSPANNTACAACGGLCMFGMCTGSGGNDSCNAADYAKAEIPIAELPGNAPAIVASLQAHTPPTTGTPTGPALTGALQFASQWQTQHPDHKTVVVLATDGDPQECSPQDKNGIAAIAAAGHNGTPPIDTYVVGMQGATMAWLDAWAAAGGTGQAYNANDPAAFVQQMNSIRGTAMTCTYTVPTTDAGIINYQSVKVTATINGADQIIPPKSSSNDCGSGDGWYYDGNNPPKTITMCPHTCDTLKNSQGTSGVQLDLGCLIQPH